MDSDTKGRSPQEARIKKIMLIVAGIKHDNEDGCPGMSPVLVTARILKLNQRVLPAENV